MLKTMGLNTPLDVKKMYLVNHLAIAEWQKIENLAKQGDTVVFKDISRFTREAENGYQKYMELYNRGIELIFIDNPTVSTPYIKRC